MGVYKAVPIHDSGVQHTVQALTRSVGSAAMEHVLIQSLPIALSELSDMSSAPPHNEHIALSIMLSWCLFLMST